MPRLLTTDPAGPAGSVRANPDSFGSQVGRAQQGFGQTVDTASRILQAAETSQARRRAAEYSIALEDQVNELQLDPDLQGREGKFEQLDKQLQSQFRGGLSGVFDSEARLVSGRLRNRLRHDTRVEAIAAGQADLQETLRIFSDQFSKADGADDQALIWIKADLAIEESIESGLIDQGAADDLRRNFTRQASSGMMRRFQNDNPAAGFHFLESGQFQGTEEERQVWRGQMISAISSRAKADLTRIRRQEALEKRRDRLALADAERFFVEKGFSEGFSEEDVLSRLDILPPTRARALLSEARSGGKFVATQSDPEVYSHLRGLAQEVAAADEVSGEVIDFQSALDGALFAREITQSDYVSLQKLAEDSQVAEYTDRIKTVLSGGMLSGPGAREKAMHGERDFIEWLDGRERAGNIPDAAERSDFADRIIRSAQLGNGTRGNAAFERLPLFAVKVPGSTSLDIQATVRDTVALLESGEIGEQMFADEIEKIKAFEERQAARSQPSGGER